jgi:ArsR family transcriptional regulator
MTRVYIKDTEQITTIFKILSDPTRLRILTLLLGEGKELCVYEIAEGVGISHSAASHQLSKLEAHNVVTSFREGQTICYEVAETEQAKKLISVIRLFL